MSQIEHVYMKSLTFALLLLHWKIRFTELFASANLNAQYFETFECFS